METHAENSPRPADHSSVSYQDNRRYVLGVLSRRCRWLDPSQREDAFHDAYVVLLEKLASGALDAGDMIPARARAYLTQTAIHKALDQGKRAARRQLVSLDLDECAELSSPEPSIEERVIAREEARRLQYAVTHLPERRRRVIELRYYLGCDPQQIQARLGVSRDVYRHELERGTRAVVQAAAA
ncbi:MAG: sigma-70 family RNA polymerase sigma factor [Actinobacteria bacterium]|nr:sigma-70 family RNA polymerase sigma factor [Actinomycetota bacterium]